MTEEEKKKKNAEYKKRYNEKNKEKIAAYQKEYKKRYNEKNKEKVAAYRKEYLKKYRQEHPEKFAAYSKKWAATPEGKEKLKEYQKDYHQNITAEQKEKNKKSYQKYQKNNPEKFREYARRQALAHPEAVKNIQKRYRDKQNETKHKISFYVSEETKSEFDKEVTAEGVTYGELLTNIILADITNPIIIDGKDSYQKGADYVILSAWVDKDVIESITNYSKRLGISRSAYLSLLVTDFLQKPKGEIKMDYGTFTNLVNDVPEAQNLEMYITERGYQDWMSEFKDEQIAPLLTDIYNIYTAENPIMAIRDISGLSAVSLGNQLSIPSATIDNWCDNNSAPAYILNLISYVLLTGKYS